MLGGQKRTIICGCGKHIKGSIREATSRAKIHAKVCDKIDITQLQLPFDATMNGLNGVGASRRGNIQQRRLNAVVTVHGEEAMRGDQLELARLVAQLQRADVA